MVVWSCPVVFYITNELAERLPDSGLPHPLEGLQHIPEAAREPGVEFLRHLGLGLGWCRGIEQLCERVERLTGMIVVRGPPLRLFVSCRYRTY
jgi:hypothetical protein